MSIQVVISRYSDDLKWLNSSLFRNLDVLIYNKGKPLREYMYNYYPIVTMRDEGCDAHTFLTHIVENYYYLADVTVFLSGSCMNAKNANTTELVMERTMDTFDSVFMGTYYNDVQQDLANFRIMHYKYRSAEISFYKWYDYFVGRNVKTNLVCSNNTFSVSKYDIHCNPLSYYEDLLQCIEGHPNPEESYYMKLAWVGIFNNVPRSCLYYLNTAMSDMHTQKPNKSDNKPYKREKPEKKEKLEKKEKPVKTEKKEKPVKAENIPTNDTDEYLEEQSQSRYNNVYDADDVEERPMKLDYGEIVYPKKTRKSLGQTN